MNAPATAWSLPVSVGALLVGAVVTTVLGVRLARAGDELADRTGMGEALFGSVFFGLMISLSGIVMTATAAAQGHASLSYSNAVGGVAAQLLALGGADLAYRRANLEHAAASIPNGIFTVVLGCLLCIALLGSFAPVSSTPVKRSPDTNTVGFVVESGTERNGPDPAGHLTISTRLSGGVQDSALTSRAAASRIRPKHVASSLQERGVSSHDCLGTSSQPEAPFTHEEVQSDLSRHETAARRLGSSDICVVGPAGRAG